MASARTIQPPLPKTACRAWEKAEANIEVLQESEDERVSLQANTFVLETIGKKNYSKKTESDITSGGKPIIVLSNEVANKYDTPQSPSGDS